MINKRTSHFVQACLFSQLLPVLFFMGSSALVVAQEGAAEMVENGNNSNPGIAVLMDFQELENSHQKTIFNTLLTRLQKAENSDFQFYDYREKDGILEFQVKESKAAAKPCEKIVFLSTDVYSIEEPELTFQRDTSGKLIGAKYVPEFYYQFQYKVIDIASSEIEAMELITPKENKKISKEISVTDYKNFFKEDPLVLKRTKPEVYKEARAKLKKKYDRQIASFYDKCVKDAARSIAMVASPMKALKDKRLFKLTGDGRQLAEGKKKLKEFEIDAGLTDDLSDGDYLDVVCKRKYGEWEVIEKLDRSIVKEEGSNTSICKPYFFGGKKMTTALQEGQEVFFVRNEILLKSINSKEGTKQTATVDKECLFCAFSIEKKIVGLPNLELIERSHIEVLTHFVELSKSDEFLDFDLAEIQGLQKGVRYVLTFEGNKLSATDVQTGKIHVEIAKTNKDGKLMKFFKNNSTVSNGTIARLFLELLQEEVEMMEVVDQKKNKVKSVLAHHPIGFVRNDRLRIYALSQEEVKGKVFERKVEIGVAMVRDLKSDNIAELSVYKGKKELAEAINNNQKIIFINE